MAKIKGIWLFRQTQNAVESNAYAAVNFTSNSIEFNSMYLYCGEGTSMTYARSDFLGFVMVYTSFGWTDPAHRVVDFGSVEQEVSDEWYANFSANARYVDGGNDPDEDGDEILAIWKSTLTGIADATREKTGKTEQMLVSEIANEIRSIKGTLPKFDGTVEVV
jgi:hypothetical protein